MTKNEIDCSQTVITPNSTSCMRLYYFIICSCKLCFIFFLFSPCSGLVLSGYSKTSTDKSLIQHLTRAMIPYKKFRKMYKVDSRKFQGKQKLSRSKN